MTVPGAGGGGGAGQAATLRGRQTSRRDRASVHAIPLVGVLRPLSHPPQPSSTLRVWPLPHARALAHSRGGAAAQPSGPGRQRAVVSPANRRTRRRVARGATWGRVGALGRLRLVAVDECARHDDHVRIVRRLERRPALEGALAAKVGHVRGTRWRPIRGAAEGRAIHALLSDERARLRQALRVRAGVHHGAHISVHLRRVVIVHQRLVRNLDVVLRIGAPARHGRSRGRSRAALRWRQVRAVDGHGRVEGRGRRRKR
mmetsp:Transcript_10932/g.28397  ORF Transcript_10932/g.28397 Transcript_10932/m.28397 type:complete len:258 (+) Transcript_10932:387-1160(+)